MAIQLINTGTLPNDGSGDPLRTAFTKINENFTELADIANYSVSVNSLGTTQQELLSIPASQFAHAKFHITSKTALASQSITISAMKAIGGVTVKFTGYGTIFNGDPVTTYDMSIVSGHVKLFCTPLVNNAITHLITYSVVPMPPAAEGIEIGLDGYLNSLLADEDGIALTTE